MSEQKFTATQIANHLNVSRTTVNNWMNAGDLPFTEKKHGKKMHREVSRADLLQFAERESLDVSGLVDREPSSRATPCVAIA